MKTNIVKTWVEDYVPGARTWTAYNEFAYQTGVVGVSFFKSPYEINSVICELETDTDVSQILYLDGASLSKDILMEIYSNNFPTSEDEGSATFDIAMSEIVCFFKDWDHHKKIQKNLIDDTKNAKEKKIINNFFDSISYIYKIVQEPVAIKLEEDGINFLENYVSIQSSESINEIHAEIYNLKLRDLQAIYNAKGKSLFRENIRSGLPETTKTRNLINNFTNYFKASIYNDLIATDFYKELDKIDKTSLDRFLMVDNTLLTTYNPAMFWFGHNGITISVEKNKDTDISLVYSVDHNTLTLDTKHASVINGAQTMTNLFSISQSIQREVIDLLNDFVLGRGISIPIDNFFESLIEKSIDQLFETIKIRTCFIISDVKYTKGFTVGLNTQVPIEEGDLIADSSTVKSINKLIKRYQVEIYRSGEKRSNFDGYSPLQFIKRILLTEELPGKSKNYRGNYDSELERILELLQNDNNANLVLYFKAFNEIEKWWAFQRRLFLQEKKMGGNNDISPSTEEILLRYAQNYFCSYFVSMTKDSISSLDYSSETIESLYDSFLSIFLELSSDFNVNDFKNDKLFKEIISTKSGSTKDTTLISETVGSLVDYLNTNKKTNYGFHKLIREYNKASGIDVPEFRVVRVSNGKIKEHFPLPNSTFSEIYQIDDYFDNPTFNKFEDSNFYEQLKKPFTIYVLNLDKDDTIIDYEMKENVRFQDLESAEKAYNQTIEAFKKGVSEEFPKASELNYHVRPKAINGDDTFVFTDGTNLTKQTFWITKSYLMEVLEIRNNI